MYKILTKLRTKYNTVYSFHTVKQEDGTVVEYVSDDLEEVKATTIELLKQVGYKDVRIVEEKPFYIEIDNVADSTIQDKDIQQMLELMEYIGSDDLILTNDASYNVSLYFGSKEEEKAPTHTVEVQTNEFFVVTPTNIVVEDGGTASFEIKMDDSVNRFNIQINGEEFKEGLPSYITYENGTLIINDIHNDLVVVLIKN